MRKYTFVILTQFVLAVGLAYAWAAALVVAQVHATSMSYQSPPRHSSERVHTWWRRRVAPATTIRARPSIIEVRRRCGGLCGCMVISFSTCGFSLSLFCNYCGGRFPGRGRADHELYSCE